jgi:hypothetical protein
MPNRFDKFVHDENLKSFGRQIEIETDPTRLTLLKTLLREEQVRRVFEVPRRPS